MKWYVYDVTNYLSITERYAVWANSKDVAEQAINEFSEYPASSIIFVGSSEDRSEIIADEFIFRGHQLKNIPKRYSYNGSVLSFGKCIQHNWKAETQAVSYSKAKNNLIFRFKKEAGLPMGSGISLPGELKEIG